MATGHKKGWWAFLKRLLQWRKPASFTIYEFGLQLEQLLYSGPLQKILAARWPEYFNYSAEVANRKGYKSLLGIIHAMTRDECENVKIVDHSRCERIARGSGTTPSDVANLIRQYEFVARFINDLRSR